MGWLWHIYGAVVRVPPSQTFHKEILQLCNEGPLNAWLWAKIDMVSNNCLLLHAAKKNRIQTSVCVSMCLGGWVRMCICLLLMSTRVCGHVKDWQAKRVRWNSVCVCVCVWVWVCVGVGGGGVGWSGVAVGGSMDMCSPCTVLIHVIIVGVSPTPLWFCVIWPRWTVGLSDKRPHAGTPVKTLSPRISSPLIHSRADLQPLSSLDT